jgi:hypothetical protein
MKKTELKSIIHELLSEMWMGWEENDNKEEVGKELLHGEKEKAEGFGWGNRKDAVKDPKHINGEFWRVKYQSEKDLKKHGDELSGREIEESKRIYKKEDISQIIDECISELVNEYKEEDKKKLIDLIKEGNVVYSVKPPVRKPETNEWVVKWYINGKYDENGTYYTDDKNDANDTYRAMSQRAATLNKK